MKSVLLSFLNKFAPKASRTATNPNSGAYVYLWRRFFEIKEEEYEKQVEAIIAFYEEHLDEREICPGGCEEMKQLRKAFNEDCRRRELATNNSSFGHFSTLGRMPLLAQPRRQEEERQLRSPNLHVPTADGSVYLPQ